MKDNQGNEYTIDHIDYKQIDKENEEKIYNSDQYARALFLIGNEDCEDVVQTEFSHAEPYMLIGLFVSMRDVLQTLAKEHPIEWEVAKSVKATHIINTQIIEDNEEENKK